MTRSSFALSFAAVGAASLFTAAPALAQATVPYTSTGWMDFGTTNITGVAGNFMPGWTTLTASPDLGYSPFFIPVDTLSGAPNDAALWFLEFDPSGPGAGGNESVELSLNGFTVGNAYQLDFYATIIWDLFASWKAPVETFDITILGASIPSFTTSLLTDPIASDNHNVWTPQTVSFTALSANVKFRFNVPNSLFDINLPARLGIDGITMTQVPAPAPVPVLLTAAGLTLSRRRRR